MLRITTFNVTLVSCLILVPGVLGLQMRLKARWKAERTNDTVTQLLLTPLSSSHIVGGRWRAVALVAGARLLPAALGFAVGTVLLALMDAEWVPSMRVWCVIVAWFVSAGVCSSIGAASPGKGPRAPLDAIDAAFWTVLLFVAEAAVFVWSMFAAPALFNGENFMPVFAAVGTLVHLIAMPFVYGRAVRDVERLRMQVCD
jgi:ABC-type Na+ efflux pump permease subunit